MREQCYLKFLSSQNWLQITKNSYTQLTENMVKMGEKERRQVLQNFEKICLPDNQSVDRTKFLSALELLYQHDLCAILIQLFKLIL
jgi:hypothetical protein